jgi:hypothetical protein
MSEPDKESETPSRYLRLQPVIVNDQMDDATPENIAALAKLAQDYIAANKDLLKNFIQSNYS